MHMEYKEVKQQIESKLSSSVNLKDTDNLIELGLNSLQVMRLINQWRKKGVKLSFGELMEEPTLAAWWEMILKRNVSKEKAEVKLTEAQVVKKEVVNQPFPLTDVQYAYWIGRRDEQSLGGIGCHAYLEFDGENVDAKRLEKAWYKVQMHHGMLRARFLEDGTQEVMAKPFTDKIEVLDFSRVSDLKRLEVSLFEVRERLSHRKLRVEIGEVAGITLSCLPQQKTRIHLDLDLLVADVQSLQIVLKDLVAAYNGQELAQFAGTWHFGTYLKKQENKEKEEIKKTQAYWEKRLATLPKGPTLPLTKRPDEVGYARFNRRSIRLTVAEWEMLQQRAAYYHTTPAVMLLTAYATVLERWSTNKKFLINMPLFNRNTEEQGLEDVVADFTTLLLLAVNFEDEKTFYESLMDIQKQIYEDMKYTKYSGVQVQRDLAQLQGGQDQTAPIVFACNLGTPLLNQSFEQNLGKFTYMISQTPQVWLDFQSYEDREGLLLTWDTVDELFPAEMIDEMLKSFENLLQRISKETWNQVFDVLPEAEKEMLAKETKISPLKEMCCLHEGFLKWADKTPEAIALIDTGKQLSLTYHDLKKRVLAVASGIVKAGICHQPVAIMLPRGFEQIEAALAVMLSGNYYVPINENQPQERIQLIIEKTGIQAILMCQQIKERANLPITVNVLELEVLEQEVPMTTYPKTSPEASAYIIMTSGSTGLPKGVEIMHQSAWNTIATINEQYQINDQDTALAISAVDFDLSVYDMFGILSAGGRLVLIPESEKRNAAFWLEQVTNYKITVWNSVPVLLDMLLVSAKAEKVKLPLRVVMLSGDWIGLELPERLDEQTEYCQFVAMGGATEAAIWSNFQNVTLPLPYYWKSIPYGKPLKGQSYRIVDCKGRDCPNWVKGELWIGGHGVAKRYRGDEKLTKEKFVEDTLGRWYRTGDHGRHWADRTIEFLGRQDHQVKVRGHRIELGEIEHAITQFDGVKRAIVETAGEKQGEKHLVAYIEANLQSSSKVTSKLVAQTCMQEIWQELFTIFNDAQSTQQAAYENFIQYADNMSLRLIQQTFESLGILKEEMTRTYTFEALLKEGKVLPKWEGVIRRWLTLLVEEGMVNESKDTYYWQHKMVEGEWNKNFGGLNDYLKQLAPHLVPILRGEEEPLAVFYGEGQNLTPNDLLKCLPGQNDVLEMLLQALAIIRKQETEKRPLRILEIGTRNSQMSLMFIEALGGKEVSYDYVDISPFFIEQAQKDLASYEFINYDLLNLELSIQDQNNKLHDYDCIIAFNALHRTTNAALVTKQLSDLLAPGGILCGAELTATTYLQEIATTFLEDGFSNITDLRKEQQSAVLSAEMWQQYFKAQTFENVLIDSELCGSSLLAVQQRKEVFEYTDNHLKDYLMQKLPEYMVPNIYHFLEHLPVTANGKIDRKILKAAYHTEGISKNKEEATTKTEETLLDLWHKLFKNQEIGISDNFFSLGGDSLVATRMLSEIEKVFSCKLSIKTIFDQATVKQLAHVIESQIEKMTPQAALTIEAKPEEENLPFPLTDVQYAYWIGRSGLYDLGNVSTHCYFELEGEVLEQEKLQWAWNALISRHGMMRAIIQADGTQCILKEVPVYEMKTYNMAMFQSDETEKALLKVREEMSHQVLHSESWPLFDVRISKKGENEQRIHISFDNLMFDGWSMFHLLTEWAMIYRTGKVAARPTLSFRDYVLGTEKISTLAEYEKDKQYWESRIESLSPAPELPLAKKAKEITAQRFHRRSGELTLHEWQSLKEKAKEIKVTPSVLLMSAYAEVLRLWSKNKDFTINLTQFDRKQLHPEVGELIGDFTTLTLLEMKALKESSFAERARIVQKQLIQDLAHDTYSAIELERRMSKMRGNGQGAVMPIVFTSGLGIEQWGKGKWLGELNYNISQTPQVWLDHQVIERDGALHLFWDSVDELFYEGMLDDMFNAYLTLLKGLAHDTHLFDKRSESLVVEPLSKLRIMANETVAAVCENTLDSMFLEAANRYKDKEAIITSKRRLTYQDVMEEAMGVCETLKESGIKQGDIVAIMMEKCWEQAVAAYGILFAGATYLPIDVHNPKERILKILEDSHTKVLLVQDASPIEEEWLADYQLIKVVGRKAKMKDISIVNHPNDLAYVIYTSGTTGVPKGVMITHKGAVNTIVDVNQKWQVTHKDTAIGLSQLHFDLSVYDLFGILGIGGTLVLPDANQVKEPSHWVQLMNKEKVTVWNSVPAFMEMLVEYELYQQKLKNKNLRLVMMSGDWIPIRLPEKIRTVFGDITMIGMGGATEASIWSNYYVIPKTIPQNWKSIPYGKPLANQKYYILDDNYQNCPDWVPGQVFIGGLGVAKGYLNDRIKTTEKFMEHPETKEGIYATGDMGRYWQTGDIEFLGRMDTQVKIKGYRIELGEIEAAICKINAIKECVVAYEKEQDELKAYMTMQDKEQRVVAEEMINLLLEVLPQYMVPKHYYILEELPLTLNGKVDRKQLANLVSIELCQIATQPETVIEKELAVIWKDILGVEIKDINESFFEVGGDSLKIIRLVNEINKVYHKEISLSQVNQYHTIKMLGQYLEEQNDDDYCGGVI